MSRRVSRIVAVVVLSVTLASPSAFAASRGDGPSFSPGDRIERIIKIVKNFVRGLKPSGNEDAMPTVPRP